MCLSCGETRAQNDRLRVHHCIACFGQTYPDIRAQQIEEESRKYLEGIAQQQEWSEREPTLQALLLLPSHLPCTLPTYSTQPEFLAASHCRLCLASFGPGGELAHLREHHPGYTHASYRRVVLRQTLSEWPQSVPSQVLRTRLAAFKDELCDANFLEKPCASCCRLKRHSCVSLDGNLLPRTC